MPTPHPDLIKIGKKNVKILWEWCIVTITMKLDNDNDDKNSVSLWLLLHLFNKKLSALFLG